MKKVLPIIVTLFSSLALFAQEPVPVEARIDSLIRELTSVKQANSELAISNAALKRRVSSLESAIQKISGQSEAIEARVATTEKGVADNDSSLRDAKDGFVSRFLATDEKISGQETSLKNQTKWGIVIALVVLAISALLTFLLSRKGSAKIDALQGKAEKLNEEIVSIMSSEAEEIRKIAASIGTLSAAGASSQNEQDLIKALADRITFMEMTLYRMDPSVRGYKQLTKSIGQMKNNLLANGYEIVDMLGKPYHEGMKVTANFVEDENIEQGRQIITGIIKPQINYQGQMIQAAQITVSQNI